jgi:hypothetical protein
MTQEYVRIPVHTEVWHLRATWSALLAVTHRYAMSPLSSNVWQQYTAKHSHKKTELASRPPLPGLCTCSCAAVQHCVVQIPSARDNLHSTAAMMSQ